MRTGSGATKVGPKLYLVPASARTENRHSPRGKACRHYTVYKLTCDDFDGLQARADGKCELCRTPAEQAPAGRLVIDHFEGEGVFFVRGLLCHTCNGIMASFDKTVSRQWRSIGWEERAREYEANSWQRPTAEQVALAELEREKRVERRRQKSRERFKQEMSAIKKTITA